jgi:outer membrane receptor protein involved in Fe transport
MQNPELVVPLYNKINVNMMTMVHKKRRVNCMRSVLVFLLAGIIFPGIIAQVQNNPGRPGPNVPKSAAPLGSGVVKGTIQDSTTSGGIEYATVGLYRQRDSTLVNGMITDPSGTFNLKGIPEGQFYLEVSFIGYIKKRVHNIAVTPQSNTLNMGVIVLHPNITQIGDVKVVAQNQRVEYKIDKKVVNVSQDIASSGGTLVNVLENTPSVQVDVEGNVSLRGSGNFQLLIDGKPSVIQGSEGLQQIPASAVQNLEIITSPSAKYDPDGAAGIINVIMKKQKNTGIGGVVNASVGTRNKYTTDFLINFRKKKLNYFIGGEFADQDNYNTGDGERRTYRGDTTIYQMTKLNGVFTRKSLNFKTGFDYTLTDKSSLSLNASVNNRKFSRDFTTLNHWYNTPSSRDSFYRDISTSADNSLFYNVSLDFQKKYDENGHNLRASFFYTAGKDNETEDEVIRLTDANYEITGLEPARTRSKLDHPESNLRAELDYTKPMGKAKLELGLQSRWDQDRGDYIFENYQPVGNEWIYNDTISNSLHYLDAIQSAYGILSGPVGKFEFQGGLRAEYDNRTLKQLTSSQTYTYDKFHFFPSFYVIRKLGTKSQLQFTFSRRINRPDERDLNPFKEFRGSNNVVYGNPGLKPEFTNSFELNYQYTMTKGFISLETYYRGTTDRITRITGIDTLNGKQVFFNTSVNADRDKSLGVELMANTDVTKWWQLNLTADVFHYQLKGIIDGADVSSVSNTWRTNFNTTFKMKWDTRLQIMGVYNGPSVTLQGKREGFFVTNLAIRKDLLKKKMTITLSARDVFATGKFAFTADGPDFYSHNQFRREAPVVTLNLTYRINNYKQAARRANAEQGGEDSGGGMDMGM